MSKNERIKKKIEKIYKRPIENVYSHRFYSDLFSGYHYSLNEDKRSRSDFYKITPNDDDIIKLFKNTTYYNFSDKLGETIDNVLYSMAICGKAYIFIKPEYIEKIDKKGNRNKLINALYIREIKGILKRNVFYYKNSLNEISELNIDDGKLVICTLKDLGFKRKYFIKLMKKIEKCDITIASVGLINDEPTYDFNVHMDKNRKKFLRKMKDIGWYFGNQGLSDSYILYKEIKMRLFKIKMLKYILGKINHVLAEGNIVNKKFEIEACIGNTDYENVWAKFQNGALTVSELSNIIWK